jgi:hypothetical protein
MERREILPVPTYVINDGSKEAKKNVEDLLRDRAKK